MQTIAVIGAGQMGSGIAQTADQFGYRVLLSDLTQGIAEKGKDGIARALEKLVSRGKLGTIDAETQLGRITAIAGYAQMSEAAIIIEAATEREAIKQKIFEDAAKVLSPEAILASNTSSIPITRMAASVPDPSRFIGMHFFHPVPIMRLVEIIPGLPTSQETSDKARAFCESLSKTVVLAGDGPGFVINRILAMMLNEAIFVLGAGIGSIEDIDNAFRMGVNHPMGPLTLADFIGLDTLLEIIKILYSTTGDGKYRPAPLLINYVEAGWIGRKVGRGFYDYSGDHPVPTR